MRVHRNDVCASKWRLLHMLCEFVHPYRGVWTTVAQQKDALSAFLGLGHIPPRTIKYGAHFVDGGEHTVASVLETIRTGVQQHARTKSIANHPVSSFFEEGQEAITDDYYQKCLDATEAYESGLSRLQTRHPDQGESIQPLAVSFPAQVAPAQPGQVATSTRTQGECPRSYPKGLPKEAEELRLQWAVLKGKLMEGPRKRSHREFLDGRPMQPLSQPENRVPKHPRTKQLESEHLKSKQLKPTKPKPTKPKRMRPKPTQPKPMQQKPPHPNTPNKDSVELETNQFISETPPPTADTTYEIEEKKERHSHVENTLYANGFVDETIPLPSRRTLGAADVRKYITQIDGQLEPHLRKAFETSGLEWTTPVTFHNRPSSNLMDLYQLCLGRNWHKAGSAPSQTASISSLEFMISLIGAGIYSRVLSIPRSGLSAGLIQGAASHNLEALWRNTLIGTVQDSRHRNSVLIPTARSMAGIMSMAIYEHLSAQPMCDSIAESGILPTMFQDAIARAFETAMLLAAELSACGDDVQPTWFETGSAYDAQCMQPSDRGTPPDRQPQAAVLTLLPGVDVRHSGGPWICFVRATVHVFSNGVDYG